MLRIKHVIIKMWHSLSESDLISQLQTNAEKGLTEEEVEVKRRTSGWNELAQSEGKSLLMMILEQFQDLMVIILLVAAVVSTVIALVDQEEGFVGYVEPIVILLILIANAIVGVWQETNAEAALEALKELQPEHARALRNGNWKIVLSREVVPGDIIEIAVGDKVPADTRILKLLTPSLRVNQSSLTGEAKDVGKFPGVVNQQDVVLQDKHNIAFSSSTVSNGSGIGVVVQTGMETEIGKIQQEVKEAQESDEKTPLQEKLDDFGELLAKIIFVICALVWVMNFRNFFDEAHGSPIRGAIYYFKIAIALAVAAVPEGLPAVITTCLALGTRRMARRNAIVMKLPSVETLGCTTVICSDKTGTLTTNEMTISDFFVPSFGAGVFESYKVEGVSFEPRGKIEGFSPEKMDEVMKQFVYAGTFCNDSRLVSENGRFKVIGTPTEGAIRVLVEKVGKAIRRYLGEEPTGYKDAVLKESGIKRLVTLEFTRERKSMSVVCKPPNSQQNIMYSKGAPESIIEKCTQVLQPSGEKAPMNDQVKRQILENVQKLSSQALRCIALAYKDDCGELSDYDGESHPGHKLLEDYSNFDQLEQGLTFLGVVGMKDPPRPEVIDSIHMCKQAGIRVFMITGDNKQTAEAVAKEIGIFEEKSCVSITGAEFERMSSSEASNILKNHESCVFSRTEPIHKKRLVQLLKGLDEVVAMTGDGVNDAPALQESQIGIAMGIAGTEVAKRASDMILADDKFSTIVAAVEEGRSIYNNTKAFIRYLISSNIGEVASIFFTAMLGLPEAFTSVQLLWVNLVTDGPPATALGFNPPDLDIMKKPPRKKNESLIDSWVFFRYMVIGTYVGLATVGIFVYWFTLYKGVDGHPLVNFYELSNWSECPGWQGFELKDWNGIKLSQNPCLYFSEGKVKASTLALSVLVTIEMLNALNALSEDCSLLQMPPWVNPWLILAMAGSMILHCVILYVPFLSQIFGIEPLDGMEWLLVFAFSFPVIIIDELLKAFGRFKAKQQIRLSKKE